MATFVCYMHHPAHFHLMKNVIINLKKKGHKTLIVCQKKDILDLLLTNAGMEYSNFLPKGRKGGKISMLYSLLRQDYLTLKLCLKHKPYLMFGTSGEICHVGKLLGIPSLYLNEDDLDVVPLLGYVVYPFAKHIMSPAVCGNKRWEKKSIKYESYHELAYLHPNHFEPESKVVEKYFPADKPFFLIRFAKLTAHHDKGIQGINTQTAKAVIEQLKPHGDIYITSERDLEPEFEQYRININPLDIHHVMAHAQMYIGDSQTMAAEAGVLGTPFIRYNDFVGRIGYLDELENKYNLGYGIKPPNDRELHETIGNLINTKNLKDVFQEKRQKMLSDKIDYAKFLTWFVEEYPSSLAEIKKNPSIQYQFK